MSTGVSKSFPPAFPIELLEHISIYLPFETRIKTAEVSRYWLKELANFRKAACDQLSEKKYVKILWDCGFRSSQFAQLKVPRRVHIDSSSTDLLPSDLCDPIMKFKNAIVMKIEGISDESILYSKPGPLTGIIFHKILIRELQSVLAILKEGDQWKVSWSSAASKGVYEAVHREAHTSEASVACPTCPFPNGGISDEILKRILTGNDPYFRLMEKTFQKLPVESKSADL